jgi:CubicO group peptidase (beta-lactamase class C family)
MKSAAWERDGRGTLIGSSYVYATPRDFAKFGYLYLNDGCWNGERLLPEGWVADSVKPSEPFKAKPLYLDPGDVQGRQFWLNRIVPPTQPALPWPGVPDDAYAARGHWGQSITVVPSLDLVIVRVADDREPDPDRFNGFLERAIAVGRAP